MKEAKVALSGEEAGKWDGQGKEAKQRVGSNWNPASDWSREPRRKVAPSPTHACAHSHHDHGWLGGGVASHARGSLGQGGSSSAPSQQLEEEAAAQGGGSGQSPGHVHICFFFWCVFQHPKRISPTPHGLDLKSNHPKHSIETG